MSTDTPNPQESTGTETDANIVTGPHDGRDSDGELDHRYWRCERCGLETTDPRLREGCFRCGEGTTGGDGSEATNRDEPNATIGGESGATVGGPPDG